MTRRGGQHWLFLLHFGLGRDGVLVLGSSSGEFGKSDLRALALVIGLGSSEVDLLAGAFNDEGGVLCDQDALA